MTDTARIKEAFERNQKAIRLRPSIGQGTAVTKARVRDGLTVDIEDGGWTFVADEGKNDGGNGAGADPGVYGRAALASCLAIGYVWTAAVENVPITSLEVEVQADYDARGPYGVDDSVPSGWTAMRYVVSIESPASEEEIAHVLDLADERSSLLYSFRNPVPIEREVQITAPAR
jgi:uncharacterized OsmC-like protein